MKKVIQINENARVVLGHEDIPSSFLKRLVILEASQVIGIGDRALLPKRHVTQRLVIR